MFRALALALLALVLATASASAQEIRLSVDKWKVEPGDNYQLQWMERSGVEPLDDYTLEECTDPQFKDTRNYTSYMVKAHRKKLENSTSLTHAVKYYRVKMKAWVRRLGENDMVKEDVYSNVVRVTLVGTTKADPVPAFPDDPDPDAGKKSKKDDDKNKKDSEYPAMGRPDLVVTRIMADPKEPAAGRPYKVSVFVRNAGVVPSEGGTVRLEVNGRAYILELEPLKPMFTAAVQSHMMQAEAAGPVKLHAKADPTEKQAESREDNNELEITIEVKAADNAGAPTTAPK